MAEPTPKARQRVSYYLVNKDPSLVWYYDTCVEVLHDKLDGSDRPASLKNSVGYRL